MALIHHFLPVSSDISYQMIKYREKYIIDGRIERYASFETVPAPIDSSADTAAGDILADFYRGNKLNALSVHDKYILRYLLEFKVVETYFIGFVPCMGLNYYGFTLIPKESLPVFISVLKRNSVRGCFRELITLSEEAYKMKCDILHCGI